MIAPPNHGADIADVFATQKIIKPFLGPNVALMMTDSFSYTNHLPMSGNSEVGIITGIRGGRKGFSPLIEGDNDGLIKPEHTLLGTEKEAVRIHDEHTRLTQNPRVIKMVIGFLKDGTFMMEK